MSATDGLVGLIDGEYPVVWCGGSEQHVRTALDALNEPTAADVVHALGVAVPFPGDSFDREAAFSLASQAFGIDYNAIYDAWIESDWRYGR